MRLESVRSLKAELAAKAVTIFDPEALAVAHATEPTMPHGVALGVAKDGDEHLLAVRTADPALGEAMKQAAKGEADVRIITITKRATPAYFQAHRLPLEPGLQIGMRGENFVGTLGCFVRDSRALYALTNSHVAADEGTASPGHVIGQPFGSSQPIGVLDRFIPFSRTAPNIVDAALVRLDSRIQAMLGFDLAVGALSGVRGPMLNEDVRKAGRTTGVRVGRVTAAELDGVLVGYDIGTLTFNDQIEVTGPIDDFSGPGDSGSLVAGVDGRGVGLLFAGGRDSDGTDRTFANPLPVVLEKLGVTLA